MQLYPCHQCHRALPREAFSNDKQKMDGRRRTCRECDATNRRNYHQTHLTEAKAWGRLYRQVHKEEVAARKKVYQAGPGKKAMLTRGAAYRKTERGLTLARASQKRLQQTEHGKLNTRIRVVRRRARFLKAEGTFSAQEWRETLKRQTNRCYYCKAMFSAFLPATMDHVTPISKGGKHSQENIVAACKPCNSRKHNKITLLL